MCAGHRGRSCMPSLQAAAAYMRKHRARLAGAAAPGPTRHSSAAQHPAAAPAAGTARAAARATAPPGGNQDVARVLQRERAEGDVAAAPARSAEQPESASMWLLAGRGRDGGNPAAGCLRCGTAASNDVDMSDGSHAPGTFDSASEPGGGAGIAPHAGGARRLSLAVHLSLEALPSPNSWCLLIAARECKVDSKQAVWAGLR